MPEASDCWSSGTLGKKYMTLDHATIPAKERIFAMNDKKIAFRLHVAKTDKIAEGIGVLHVCEEQNEMMSVMLDITRWPETPTGTIHMNDFWLTEREVELIRPSRESTSELECFDPRIPLS